MSKFIKSIASKRINSDRTIENQRIDRKHHQIRSFQTAHRTRGSGGSQLGFLADRVPGGGSSLGSLSTDKFPMAEILASSSYCRPFYIMR